MVTALIPALVFTAAVDAPLITPEMAGYYSNHEVVVQGQVTEVGESEDGTTLFLNFGGRYPDHSFNAVIFERDVKSFPDARFWEGKFIRVRGKVQRYKGKGMPEIVLKRKEQVTIEAGTEYPGGAGPNVTKDEDQAISVDGGLAGTGTDAVTDFDSPPRPLKITRPPYPQEAFEKKVEGTVVVEVLISAEGRVVRARVIRSVPLLDAVALQEVYQWVFKPAMKNGRPVATIAHAPVAFRIYGKVSLKASDLRRQKPVKSPNQ